MRTKVIAGNWKMNKTPSETAAFIRELARALPANPACEIVICPPTVCLSAAADALRKTGATQIRLGAQNVHFAEKGAYTGETSAAMLRDLGVTHVIIGHSERRQYFGETDETVGLRTEAAVRAGLTPIVCVGETLAQRENFETDALMARQTHMALEKLSNAQIANVIIAYEPVWAIGTGRTATDEQANETIGVIRAFIRGERGDETADAVRIQYGGSMNAKNAKGLNAMPEIDGGLIGGASLVAADFAVIVNSTEA